MWSRKGFVIADADAAVAASIAASFAASIAAVAAAVTVIAAIANNNFMMLILATATLSTRTVSFSPSLPTRPLLSSLSLFHSLSLLFISICFQCEHRK